MSDLDYSCLPDGRQFAFWDCQTAFIRDIYVDAHSTLASHLCDGSAERPYSCIDDAAAAASAGSRVVIRGGIYRETVRRICSGQSPEQMISFEAAPGETVRITGSEIWQANWQFSTGVRQTMAIDELDLFTTDNSAYYARESTAVVWMGLIPRRFFDGFNPFAVINMPSCGFTPRKNELPHPLRTAGNTADYAPFLQRQGLLFCDGKPLRQVVNPYELWLDSGTYWVEQDGLTVHFRLQDDGNPRDHMLDLAVREQAFAPDRRGTGYIRLKNLSFDYFANPFIPPQKGVISTHCGHHWIIEDCSINWANSVGIDIGFGSHFVLYEGFRGGHVIRGNSIGHCGVSGVCGLPTRGRYLEQVLVENNVFVDNCWHNIAQVSESAAIKNHYTRDCLYRRNIIIDSHFGVGLYLDKCISNTRICANVFINNNQSHSAMVVIEAAYEANRIDHNLMWGNRAGIYATETDNLQIIGNLIVQATDAGIICPHINPGKARLIGDRRTVYHRGFQIQSNLISHCGRAIDLSSPDHICDRNLYGPQLGRTALFQILSNQEQHNFATWRQLLAFDENGAQIGLSLSLDPLSRQLELEVHIQGDAITQRLDLNEPSEIAAWLEKQLCHGQLSG